MRYWTFCIMSILLQYLTALTYIIYYINQVNCYHGQWNIHYISISFTNIYHKAPWFLFHNSEFFITNMWTSTIVWYYKQLYINLQPCSYWLNGVSYTMFPYNLHLEYMSMYVQYPKCQNDGRHIVSFFFLNKTTVNHSLSPKFKFIY